jgi:sugar lactone lactonase YvrE
MRTTLNHLRYPSRSLAAKAWIILLVALTFSLCAAGAGAQTNVVVTQATRLFTLSPSGGWGNGASPLGGTFAVNQNGGVVFWSEYTDTGLFLINSLTGAVTQLNTVNNAGAVAIDNQNNIYFAQTYSSQIAKIPYNAATGTYAAYPSGGPTANCTGAVNTTTDTATCVFAINLQDTTGYYGNAALAIDGSGNFIVATNQWPGEATNNKPINNSILLCNTACQTGTQYDDPPTVIYTDSTPTDAIGAIAVDPWGNIFYTDGAFGGSPGSPGPVTTSGLYEIPLTQSGYGTTPTSLVSFTNTQAYNDDLSGVAIDQNGTVYYTISGGGVFAIPNTQSKGPDVAHQYAISTVGGKGLTLDAQGDVYVNAYTTTDGVTRVSVGNVTLASSKVGKQSSVTNVTVIDNNGGDCTSPPTITLTPSENGATTTEFSATAGACGTQMGGINFPLTVNFTPGSVGERLGVLGASDGTNTGAAIVSGIGQGPLVTLDPGVWTSYTSGFSTPYAVALDATGDLFVADPGAGKVFEIASGGGTPTSIGSFTQPYALAFDTNGFLWVADAGTNEIDEVANVGTKDQGQSTEINDNIKFGGTAINGPSGLAFGPDGVLYISDLGNGRVVTYNPSNGFTAVRATGLTDPWGLAVDGANTLYVADTGGGDVKVYQGGASITTLAPTGVTAPWAVAVDSSGSVLISDKASGKIVRVPNAGGALKTANALIIETNPKSAYGLTLDGSGNLYSTDSSGSAVYAVQRTAASVNFGSVDDDSSVTSPIEVESAGNTALTLGSPIFTPPTPASSDITLAAASNNGCTATSGAVGTVCALSAEFAPANATPAGALSATSTLSSNALNAGSATLSLTGTAVFENLQSQTISFSNPFPKGAIYGQSAALSATATSKLPVSFSVTGPATVTGAKLSFTGVGSVTVTASQAGNTTWAPAPPVAYTFAVGKATLTITAQNVKVKWGTPFPNPTTLTYAATGFKYTDTKTVLSGAPTFKYSATVNDHSTPGVYSGAVGISKGTLAAANYNLFLSPGNIVIEVLGTVPTPTFSPAPGKFDQAEVKVTISVKPKKGETISGVKIYYTYTAKGQTPRKIATDLYDGKPIILKTKGVLEAFAVAPGYTQSLTDIGTYVLVPPTPTPSFSLGKGTYTKGTKVAISDANKSATIYYTYTVAGQAPKQIAADKYTGKITLNQSGVLEAIAIAPGHSVSALASVKYTIH